MRLKDKVALITGAGSGIGKASALLFAKEGASVVIAGRRREPLEAVVESILTKGGVNQLVKCMAIDCAEYNVRVNAVCPGRVMSEMVAHLYTEKGEWGGLTKPYPLGMTGKPEHVASAALYLASDESAWVTGTLLPVDGGYLTY